MNGDVSILGTDLEEKTTIDVYKSLIWVVRYNSYGDFEIYLPINNDGFSERFLEVDENQKNIWMDCYASIRDSERLMILEQFRINHDEESGDILVITGRSLESILMRRIVWGLKVLNGNLQTGIHSLLDDCIINPKDANRKIDNFVFLESQDPAITSLTLNAQFTGDNLYDIIAAVCEANNIGFKIEFDRQTKNFVFSLYNGVDRSYDQSSVPSIIFSKKNENLISSEFLESNAFLKNVTLIGGEGEGSDRKYVDIGNASGLNRREIFTDARDISSKSGGFVLLTSQPSDWSINWMYYYINIGTQDDPIYQEVSGDSAPSWVANTYYEYDNDIVLTDSEYNDLLIQRGENTLLENKEIRSFSGTIDPFGMHKYGVDFFIGDVVEMDDGYGHNAKTRVVEVVRSIDDTGFFIYPTFSLIEEENNGSN